jgi:tetratricopeptide (TPR) repeat protein
LAIIDDFPYNELAWFNLASAYQGIKLYEKCIDAYKFVVAINEKFDYAYRNMADAFIRLRKFKDAIEIASQRNICFYSLFIGIAYPHLKCNRAR